MSETCFLHLGHPAGLGPLLSVLLFLPWMGQAPRTIAQEVPDIIPPPGCSSGSCYPPTGNLIIGRGQSLRTSSTCGLHGPERYCIVSLLQDSKNCFFCDSQDQGGHSIENVISQSGQNSNRTWWQAESGVENVTIQLDLEGVFHFTQLIMTFKTFRPAVLLLERSVDHDRSWHVYRYFAHNCSGLFPGIPSAPGQRGSDLICDQRYSDMEPATEGKVIFKVLDPDVLEETQTKVLDPNNPKIQELLRVTNLRVNFSKLHILGDRSHGSLRGHPYYYYALYELVALGSCLCYGHASECMPAPGAPANVEGMVHGLCVCLHHTAGAHCERCQDLYQDHPWRAAEPGHPHTCRKCECHGHAHGCHFDMALYLASGNVSGGVCDACQHNTAGRHCELCRPFFYRDLQEDLHSPHACRPCDCDPVGALERGLCDPHTDETRGLLSGQCRCKVHVWGQRCDSCQPGHYGLSPNKAEGCQPCRCDSRGQIPGPHTCDPSSGACHCKRFVFGRDCSRCLPEFWGLSSDSLGCRPCDCDFGGAYSNRCSAREGLCSCRPHLRGRRCQELQSGYFCAALDQATAEAELGQNLQPKDPRLPGAPWPISPNCSQAPATHPGRLRRRLRRQHDPQCGHPTARRMNSSHQFPQVPLHLHRGTGPASWTGLGFAHVVDGSGLSLLAPTVPRALEYDIVLCYATQAPEDWQVLARVQAHSLPSSTRCTHLPSEQLLQAALTPAHRAVVLSGPFCFEPGIRYSITLRLWHTRGVRRPAGSTILLDSIVLVPRVSELPGLRTVDRGALGRLQELHKAGCMEATRMGPSSPMPEACAHLICSISALLHRGGALACECHPQGSLSTECVTLGGQCPCRPNIIGRTCDHCMPGTYGFGPIGCSGEPLGRGGQCHCHLKGATSAICNPRNGQCTCRAGLAGRRCDHCLPGRWGFPQCQPCACNGHAEACHPLTGVCQFCHGATVGRHCERCLDGYYGDPTLGSGQRCRPCLCPGPPGSGLYHGSSCHVDSMSGHVVCLCAPGYAGPRCDRCSSGYFGRPWPGGDPQRSPCRPCQCNNIDPEDPAACDPLSGHCQRCLHHSHGPNCAHCRPGFHGSALRPHGCQRCSCDPQGTVPARCPSGADICFCNQVSGWCPCRPHTVGRNCNHCAPLFWNLGGPRGCEPCNCHPRHTLQPVCHPVTGQCPCQAGFGGRMCSQCQDGYWGDPEQECRACACDPQGSMMPSCNPHTGTCLCREGISGMRCQACAWGTKGAFPHCTPCPSCFTSWEQPLVVFQRHLESVIQDVANLCQGKPGWGAGVQGGRLQALKRELQQAQMLLGSLPSAVETQLQLTKWTARYRKEMTVLSKALGTTRQIVAKQEPWVRGQWERLEELFWELDCIKGLAWTMKTTQAQGAEAQVFSAALLSQGALLRAQVVTTLGGPNSVLGHTQEAQQRTESLLWERGWPTGIAVWERKLKGLLDSIQSLEPQLLKLAVKAGVECRGQGPGLACVPVSCGVPCCPGTLPTASWALVASLNSSHCLDIAVTALEQHERLLQQIHVTASLTRMQAQDTWYRARGPWTVAAVTHVQATVQSIRRFLQDKGADIVSVELMAWRALAVPLPKGGAVGIALQLEQIQGALPKVDAANQEMPRAEGVLQHAQQTKEDSVRARDQALNVQGVLVKAETHARTAEQGIWAMKETLGSLEASVQEVAGLLPQVTLAMDVAPALEHLSGATVALRTRVVLSDRQVQEAEERAVHATSLAGILSKELQVVRSGVTELQEGTQDLMAMMQNARERVQRAQGEAQELMKQMQNSWSHLEGLEQRLAQNERALEEKVATLWALEQQAAELLKHMQLWASAQATC